MKVLVLYGCPSEGLAPLKEADFEVVIPEFGKKFTSEEIYAHLPDTYAIIANSRVDADMIASAPALRLICAYGAGFDNIDVEAATQKGILVCNVPQTVTDATAEITIGLMMDVMRRITELDRKMRTGQPEPLFRMGCNMGCQISGSKLGIIGMGRIGKKVADIGRALGMEIYYYSRSRKADRDALGDIYLPLNELLAKCDVISLHCPLTPQTKGLISENELALMKPTAYLINTARGNVVEDTALIKALREHKIAGAGLDVFTNEPNLNREYLTLDNVVLAPHIGSNTIQSRYAIVNAIAHTILTFRQGGTPDHMVNPTVLQHTQE